jgi:hypothetical protein
MKSLTTFIVVYTIALSFIPLIHQTFIAQSSWLGYGTGAYAFQSPNYFVLFNDPYDGSSKPNIHVNPSFAPNERISLVEFSDWTSYVNGYNLFNDFNVTIRASGKILDATYMRPSLTLHKFIDLSSPGSVIVKFVANREVSAHFEMWKWILTSVNGVTVSEAPKPTVIPISTNISFAFNDQTQHAVGSGEIALSRVPSQIEVWPFEGGFNRVTVDFVNSEMAFGVSGFVAGGAQAISTWNYADLPYVLPAIAILVVAIYLLVERYGRKNKARTRSPRR